MESQISVEFASQSKKLLDESLVKIFHCLDQLSDQQIWWRPEESLNSIGNLILHICGNLEQWAISGVGGQPDTRDRQSEFDQREMIERQALVSLLNNVTSNARSVIDQMTPSQWTEQLVVQGFSVTRMGAITHTCSHFLGHTHQIILLTRMQLGDHYQFQWAPGSQQNSLPI